MTGGIAPLIAEDPGLDCDLDELARRIKAAHRGVELGLRKTLAAAMDAGDLLLEAKRRVGHGAFLPWLAEHVGLSRVQTARYMRAARNRHLLANVSPETHLTGGLRLLAAPDGPDADLAPDGADTDPAGGTTDRIFLRRPRDGDDEWHTPPAYVEAARAVLGGIDLDPATSLEAQARVRATRFFTIADDGLARPWRGRVWLNPPYAKDLVGPFVTKLLAEHEAGAVPAAVLLVHARTDTGWFHDALRAAAALCLTRKRIRFERQGEPGVYPTDGSAFFYFGRDVGGFADHFAELGTVVIFDAPPAGAARRGCPPGRQGSP